ncbi:MAG: NUDIX hydrolase [Actinomycetota bacterium]
MTESNPRPPGGWAPGPDDDHDPTAVPISHAATVMILDDRGPEDDLHVLLVHRTARVVFAPDMWVFPGGRVDPDDHAADLERLCTGLTDAEASAILEVERGGLAWWLAAARETLEESGLLLAATAGGSAPSPATIADLRARVLDDERAFADELVARDITIDVTPIEEVARFITPVGPPRRFDARFFVARTPPDQEPSHDAGEIVNHSWFRPADALARWQAGDMAMMSPTVRMVACLTRYRSADDVLAVARRRLPYQRVRVDDPEGEYRVLLPGEPGYEAADLEVESGWVRLWEPNPAPRP